MRCRLTFKSSEPAPTQINSRPHALRGNPSVARPRQLEGRLGRRPPKAAGAGTCLLSDGAAPHAYDTPLREHTARLGCPPSSDRRHLRPAHVDPTCSTARLAAASDTPHPPTNDPSIHRLSPISYLGSFSYVRGPPLSETLRGPTPRASKRAPGTTPRTQAEA